MIVTLIFFESSSRGVEMPEFVNIGPTAAECNKAAIVFVHGFTEVRACVIPHWPPEGEKPASGKFEVPSQGFALFRRITGLS
jgi:hypothetical protein